MAWEPRPKSGLVSALHTVERLQCRMQGFMRSGNICLGLGVGDKKNSSKAPQQTQIFPCLGLAVHGKVFANAGIMSWIGGLDLTNASTSSWFKLRFRCLAALMMLQARNRFVWFSVMQAPGCDVRTSNNPCF